MVEIEFKPLRKVVVHEEIEHELNYLIRLRVLGLQKQSLAQPLYWAEGIVFSRSMMPLSEEISKQMLEGILHFQAIEWAYMPKYRKEIKHRGITIPVIDMSDNPTVTELARALKKSKKV